MFPPTRGELSTSAAGPRGVTHDGKVSALVGDVAEAASASAPAAAGPRLSEEELKRKAAGLLDEYVATGDGKEAVLCARELNAPDFMPELVFTALSKLLDSIKPRDQEAIVALTMLLFKSGVVRAEDIRQGFSVVLEDLGDLSVDYPLAPKLVGEFLGSAVGEGALPLGLMRDACEKLEYCDKRREFSLAVFQAAQARLGDAGLSQKCREEALSAGVLLEADPEFDEGLPSVEAFLKQNKLTGIVPL
jgi:hypothetical protein